MSNHSKGAMGITYSEPVYFDGEGVGVVEKTVPSIGMTVDVRGWISGPNAVYDIQLESPNQYEWKGILPEEEIQGKIKLGWGSTRIRAVIRSNLPNTTAGFHLTA